MKKIYQIILLFSAIFILQMITSCQKLNANKLDLEKELSGTNFTIWNLVQEEANGVAQSINIHSPGGTWDISFNMTANEEFEYNSFGENFSRLLNYPSLVGQWKVSEDNKVIEIILTDSLHQTNQTDPFERIHLQNPINLSWEVLKFSKKKKDPRFVVREIVEGVIYEYSFVKHEKKN